MQCWLCTVEKTNVKVQIMAAEKKTEIIDGYTIKYHANGKTRWSKGKVVDGEPSGYWEWYRLDGTLNAPGTLRLASQSENGSHMTNKARSIKLPTVVRSPLGR